MQRRKWTNTPSQYTRTVPPRGEEDGRWEERRRSSRWKSAAEELEARGKKKTRRKAAAATASVGLGGEQATKQDFCWACARSCRRELAAAAAAALDGDHSPPVREEWETWKNEEKLKTKKKRLSQRRCRRSETRELHLAVRRGGEEHCSRVVNTRANADVCR